MCGIVGAVARRDVPEILIEGLRRLEYRGYDSAGVAVVPRGSTTLVRRRAVGKVQDLADKVAPKKQNAPELTDKQQAAKSKIVAFLKQVNGASFENTSQMVKELRKFMDEAGEVDISLRENQHQNEINLAKQEIQSSKDDSQFAKTVGVTVGTTVDRTKKSIQTIYPGTMISSNATKPKVGTCRSNRKCIV